MNVSIATLEILNQEIEKYRRRRDDSQSHLFRLARYMGTDQNSSQSTRMCTAAEAQNDALDTLVNESVLTALMGVRDNVLALMSKDETRLDIAAQPTTLMQTLDNTGKK